MTGWAPGPDGPDDAPSRPVPAPDDRLWRHPSEMQELTPAPVRRGRGSGPGRAGRSARRAGVSVTAGLLLGAAVTTGAMAAGGVLRRSPAATTHPARTTGMPAVLSSSGDGRDAGGPGGAWRSAGIGANLAAGAARAEAALVAVEVDRAGGSTTGAGVLMQAGEAVLTTYDLVQGATAIWVRPASGQRLVATVVGLDGLTDVAVLRAPGAGPSPLAFGPEPVAGEVVTAFAPAGNGHRTSLEIGEVMSIGLNSAPPESRPTLGAVVSDLALPAQAEGGPLLDTRGRLVGMVTRPGTDGAPTLGVPSSVAQEACEQILVSGGVSHGWLGVETMAPVPDGLLVTAVAAGGPAERAGLHIGDVILGVDGRLVRSRADLLAAVSLRQPGEEITVIVRHLSHGTAALEVRLGSDQDQGPADEAV